MAHESDASMRNSEERVRVGVTPDTKIEDITRHRLCSKVTRHHPTYEPDDIVVASDGRGDERVCYYRNRPPGWSIEGKLIYYSYPKDHGEE